MPTVSGRTLIERVMQHRKSKDLHAESEKRSAARKALLSAHVSRGRRLGLCRDHDQAEHDPEGTEHVPPGEMQGTTCRQPEP